MHRLGQHMTTSDLWHCLLTFQRLSKVTDLGWPHICIVANLAVLGCLEVPIPHTWLFSHIDMFIVPLQTIRFQSGPLTQFTLRRFCRLGWRCSLPGCFAMCHTYSTNKRQPHFVCSESNEEPACKSFMSLRLTVFEIYSCKVEKL